MTDSNDSALTRRLAIVAGIAVTAVVAAAVAILTLPAFAPASAQAEEASEGAVLAQADDAPASRPLEKGELRNQTDPVSGEPTSADHFVPYEDHAEAVYARIHFATEANAKKASALGEDELRELYTKAYLTRPDGTTAGYGETVLELDNERCPVSGEEAGRTDFINYNATKIYLCCPGCDAEFLSDPDRYLHNVNNAIDEARAAQGADQQSHKEARATDCGHDPCLGCPA